MPRTLDITEDLTRDQLAELAFAEEIVVYWETAHGERQYGIISSYDDETGDFEIDPVVDDPAKGWVDLSWTDNAVSLPRSGFTVFGPANREPENRRPPAADAPLDVRSQQTIINLASTRYGLAQFLAALAELELAKQEHFNDLAFNVRLDSKVVEPDGSPSRPYNKLRNHRLLVRPAEAPMMHEEIETCLRIASRYELSCSVSNAGVEIHRPEDVV